MAGVVVLQAVAVHLPVAQGLFATTDLAPGDWLVALAIAITVLWLEELRKAMRRRAQRSYRILTMGTSSAHPTTQW